MAKCSGILMYTWSQFKDVANERVVLLFLLDIFTACAAYSVCPLFVSIFCFESPKDFEEVINVDEAM